MRIAVVGDRGMFGQEMMELLRTTESSVVGFNRTNLDLSTGVENLAKVFQGFDAIINAIAITNVEEAERNPGLADLVNGHYAGLLAKASSLTDSLMIQLSTNYVFDSQSATPISIHTKPNPVNAYGSSKALGERLVATHGKRYIIFRTAWLYGSHGRNFPNPIAVMLKKEGSISIVQDLRGQPTWTKDLANLVYEHCKSDFGEKIVHGVSSGSASWFEFAKAVWQSTGSDDREKIQPIYSSDFRSLAARPRNCVLDNLRTSGPIIGNWLDRWEIAAREVLGSV